MCKNLVAKGNLQHPLLLQNRTPASTHALSARLPAGSTRVALTLAEVVTQSDLIFTCVGDDRAVLAVFEELSLQPGIGGKVLVDCSTVHPDTSTRLAEIAAGRGAQFVACPVFGAPAVAEAGMLVAIAAGPAAAVQKLRPYLTGVMARATLDFSGEEPGKASCLKVIGCTMLLNMIEALAEGHVLAEKTGLGPERLHLFVEEMFGGAYAAYSKRMLSGDYFTREPVGAGSPLLLYFCWRALTRVFLALVLCRSSPEGCRACSQAGTGGGDEDDGCRAGGWSSGESAEGEGIEGRYCWDLWRRTGRGRTEI